MKKLRKNKTEDSTDMAFKGVLYPDEEQQTLIAKTFGCCRFVYNRALDERITEYRENKRTVTLYEQINELPYLRKQEETEWLKERQFNHNKRM